MVCNGRQNGDIVSNQKRFTNDPSPLNINGSLENHSSLKNFPPLSGQRTLKDKDVHVLEETDGLTSLFQPQLLHQAEMKRLHETLPVQMSFFVCPVQRRVRIQFTGRECRPCRVSKVLQQTR